MTTTPKPPAETKQDPRDLVIAALVGTLLSPFTGMLRAIVYQILWNWFLATQYGEGPTLKTWFGIGALCSLIAFRQAASGDLPGNPVRRMFDSAIIGSLMLGAALVAAAMARVVWGWQ
jgi:hypothetical protein